MRFPKLTTFPSRSDFPQRAEDPPPPPPGPVTVTIVDELEHPAVPGTRANFEGER